MSNMLDNSSASSKDGIERYALTSFLEVGMLMDFSAFSVFFLNSVSFHKKLIYFKQKEQNVFLLENILLFFSAPNIYLLSIYLIFYIAGEFDTMPLLSLITSFGVTT